MEGIFLNTKIKSKIIFIKQDAGCVLWVHYTAEKTALETVQWLWLLAERIILKVS